MRRLSLCLTKEDHSSAGGDFTNYFSLSPVAGIFKKFNEIAQAQ